MKKKKGQITLFIILGIIIFLIIASSIYFYNKPASDGVEKIQSTSLERVPIDLYIQECINNIGRKGIYLIGLQGGYLNSKGDPFYSEEGDGAPPFAHYFLEDSALPYAVDGNKNNLRSIRDMEGVLSNYVLVEFPLACNLTSFEEIGYSIQKPQVEETSSTIIIGRDSVFIKLTYPLVFKRPDHTLALEEFAATIPVRLGLIHEKSQLLINKIINSKMYNIRNDCADYSAEDGLLNLYTITNIYEKNYAIKFVDAQPTVNYGEVPFKFQFAAKNKEFFGECVG